MVVEVVFIITEESIVNITTMQRFNNLLPVINCNSFPLPKRTVFFVVLPLQKNNCNSFTPLIPQGAVYQDKSTYNPSAFNTGLRICVLT